MSSPLPSSSRERVIRLLTDRYADDTLTVEQFEAELDRLNALTDPAELERMADGLTTGPRPAVGPARRDRPTAAGWAPARVLVPDPAPPCGLGWQRGTLVPTSAADEGRVVALLSATHRAGPWAVPRSLRVWAVMSEAVVDLRDAVLPVEGCEIEVGAVMANVRILLPPGVEARVELIAFMGSTKDDTRATPGGASGPRVRVTGSAVMAEVQVFGS